MSRIHFWKFGMSGGQSLHYFLCFSSIWHNYLADIPQTGGETTTNMRGRTFCVTQPHWSYLSLWYCLEMHWWTVRTRDRCMFWCEIILDTAVIPTTETRDCCCHLCFYLDVFHYWLPCRIFCPMSTFEISWKVISVKFCFSRTNFYRWRFFYGGLSVWPVFGSSKVHLYRHKTQLRPREIVCKYSMMNKTDWYIQWNICFEHAKKLSCLKENKKTWNAHNDGKAPAVKEWTHH